MTRFLQISRWWDEEHSNGQYATFKCLSCYATFEMSNEDTWFFCPKCGTKLSTINLQYIPEKKYRDNAGFSTTDENGKWIKINPPMFELLVEVRCTFFQPDMWEKLPNIPMPQRGRHSDLKHYIKWYNQDEGVETRFRIIPSTPLPLP